MRRYRFIDFATQGYLFLVILAIVVARGGAVAGWGGWLIAHLLCAGVVHGLIHASAARPDNPTLDFLRHFYPVLLYPFFYRATGSLNQLFQDGYADAIFQQWDEQIFGSAPSLRFMAAWPHPVVSELFYAAYFSYYVMIPGVGLALLLRRRAEFQHYISVVSLVFYVCYLIYIFLPVVGPPIYYPELRAGVPPTMGVPAVVPEFPAAVQSGPFFKIMAAIYRHLETPGAAFPSSHVAVALVTLSFSFRYLPRIRWVHLVAVALLCVATVYCRYHYVVDVVAGGLTAAVLLPLGNWLHGRFGDYSDSAR